MRQDLCKIIDKACVHLIDEIDPDNGFLNRLQADGILSPAQIDQCQQKTLTRREKIEKLLPLLKCRPDDCFQKFCLVLDETGHEELVKKYLMKPAAQRDGQASTSSAVMQTDSAATKRKSNRNIATKEQHAKRIKKEADDYEKNALLLDKLTKRPDSELESFYSCLDEDKQRHIVDIMIGRETEDGEFVETADGQPVSRRSSSSVEDSWDTPADRIVVKKAAPQFYAQTHCDAYPMHRETRGAACIISVYETVGERPRGGTQTDVKKLAALFKQMHFSVSKFYDDHGLTSQEIKAHIERMAKKQFKRQRPQCFVLFLLCHGIMDKSTREEFVLGTDGVRLSKNEIMALLAAEPNLRDVPTLVFFVCCREERELRHDAVTVSPDHPFVIGFPCQEASWSLRNNKGTRYVRCLVEVLLNDAHNTDVEVLLEKVNDKLRKLKPDSDQFSEYQSTLPKNKKLYFYPGIID